MRIARCLSLRSPLALFTALAFAVPVGCSSSGDGDDASGGAQAGGGGEPGAGAGGSGKGGSGGSQAGGAGGEAKGGGAGGGEGGSQAGGTGGGATGGSGGGMTGGTAGTTGGTGGSTPDNGTEMSFFVTSAPLNKGGDLGGLDGADAHCRMLAMAVNAKRKMWFAYLGVENGPNDQPVHPKDRIGQGPWYNQKKQMFAKDLASLHPTVNPMTDRMDYIAVKPADALFMDEKGATVPGNHHDILTGAKADGTVATGLTCKDWTSSAMADKANAGHSDTPGNTQFSPSWNAAHETTSCTQMGVSQRGGNGRFYCFATD